MLNRDILEGNWKQLKGRAKQQWGKLTDDELDQFTSASVIDRSSSLSPIRH